MNRQQVFQPSLFPSQKGQFNPSDFERTIEGTRFEEALTIGLNEAMSKTKAFTSSFGSPLILFGQILHVCAFASIQQACMRLMGDNLPEFFNSQEGNQKSYFTYGDYIFIVEKADVKKQQTTPNRVIIEQQGDNHVISVSYLLDEMREEMVSVKLEYKIGSRTLYSRPLEMEGNTVMTESPVNEPEIKKLKFKENKSKDTANGNV